RVFSDGAFDIADVNPGFIGFGFEREWRFAFIENFDETALLVERVEGGEDGAVGGGGPGGFGTFQGHAQGGGVGHVEFGKLDGVEVVVGGVAPTGVANVRL